MQLDTSSKEGKCYDRGGDFGLEALKYVAEISNLKIEEKSRATQSERKQSSSRRKRDVKDFFSNTWEKIKKFFKRTFGRRQEAEVSSSAPHPSVHDRDEDEAEDEKESTDEDLRTLYSVPFQFVQLANGSIPEIRFAENEIEDGRIRNFKRHLVDAFATQLNFEQRQKSVVERTVTGEHDSHYNITVDGEIESVTLAGYSAKQKNESTVTVKKHFTEEGIRKLAPSEALNDKDKMQLTMQQVQVFKGGKLLSSSGTSSIVILPNAGSRKSRKKRNAEHDPMSNFHAVSSFDLQLRRRQKRSTEETTRLSLHKNLAFYAGSRFAEKEGSRERQKLRRLQEISGDKTQLVESLMESSDADEYEEKMQLLSEMIDREITLQLDDEPDSASNAVRNGLTEKTLQDLCAKNFSLCKDILQLLAVAGGPKAESVFLFFLYDRTTLTSAELRSVAAISSDLTNPSATFLNSLIQVISQKQLDSDVLGSLCLAAGSLGSTAAPDIKRKISKTLVDLLQEEQINCKADGFLLDILEGIGNLGCSHTVPYILEVSRNCKENSGIQIACAHALRHNCHLSSVAYWMRNITAQSDCEVVEAVAGTVLDKIYEQQMVGDTTNWPRNGFNDVDEILKELLISSKCSVEDTILYFSRKKDPMANAVAQNYFGPETELFEPGANSRQKRSLWDKLNCDEWTEDSKFHPIQDKDEFASDRALYNRRKSCLAFRRLGIKGANAEIYAGMFAGVKDPSEPPKYKLFTKFVSGFNFLDHEMEVGSLYIYHRSGETKAYIRILGKTRQEFTHNGCIPAELKYRPITHIPLYLVTVASLQISLGIHLSGHVGVGTDCPKRGAYQLEPMSGFRVGGEALGTVGLARGGINLGGNFNYKLQFIFTPLPNMCIQGSHGYDPMSVSFETYYQLWNAIRDDWGRHRVWRPKFLSWDVTRGRMEPWFDDTCIERENDSSTVIDSEREMER